ncbi:hypothetical protein CSUB01_04197 [Colletotrichum sublineola]|uniref:Uncharacterized protein n=1 Tax=Colletotrichum sublineola TaxID=1173701 RepID=A0A066X4A4_COLSU|nr:hypothetical protein CSUB01_04197 [Colletotrichum sublineola]
MHSPSEPPEIITTPVKGQAESRRSQESWSFLEDVKAPNDGSQKRFEGSRPDVYEAFIRALSGFHTTTKQETEDVDERLVSLHETVGVLLHGHQDLMERFESSLPRDYLNRRRNMPEHQS